MKSSLAESRVKQRKGYQPDLSELLSQCELNYWLLNQLLPGLVKGGYLSLAELGQTEWSLGKELIRLKLRVTDIARYTTTAHLSIKPPFNLGERTASAPNKGAKLKGFELIIRLYHDAKMLEVMEGSGPAALAAIHTRYGSDQKPVDEKRQINRFVGECLRACIGSHHSSDDATKLWNSLI